MIQNLLTYIRSNSLNIIIALLILSATLIFAYFAKQWLRRKIRNTSSDPTVKLFVLNLVYVLVILMTAISALSRLGVPTASMLTVLGAASLAIALSLKDSLSHVASGLILIGLKPFHIGDTVDINGVLGTLDQINLLNIRIHTPNGDTVIIPNSKVFSDKICTKGKYGSRRIDLSIGISYESNIQLAKTTIQKLLAADDRIFKQPEAQVVVKELADSAVLLAVRPWVANSNYGAVLFDLTEAIKAKLDEQQIEIPYPQIQMHMKS